LWRGATKAEEGEAAGVWVELPKRVAQARASCLQLLRSSGLCAAATVQCLVTSLLAALGLRALLVLLLATGL
jgi:hypothetical protein